MSVVAVKITSLQRCASRARQAFEKAGGEFRGNYDLQDAAILNVVRACETAIDLASMVIRARHLGMPAESRELFAILEREGCITPELGARLRAMVGFRNLAVHQYRDIDLDVVERIIRKDLDNLLAFAQLIGRLLGAIQ
jgi:uncharacterized protein YutE (UPF0331/DUF86 family)